MSLKINNSGLLLVTFLSIFFFHSTGEAKSFPFRSVHVGDNLPVITLRNIADQQEINLEKFQNQPLMLVFFGADLPAKKKRAVKALKAINSLAPYIQEKGFTTLLINTQDDPTNDITEVIDASGLSFNAYRDVGQQAYAGLGIFVMPSLLLVAADGKISGGLGYSRDLKKRLKGEIEVMLGDKTRAQVEEELHPKMIEKSAEEKGAKRHFLLGMTMIKRGQPGSAMREFKKAIDIDSSFAKAHINLGCLQLDEGLLDDAKTSLAKGMALEPDLLIGNVCLARIKANEGDIDGAIDDIGFLMLRNSRNSNIHYVLGTMLESKTDQAGAMKEYRQAYELLVKSSVEK